MTWILNSVMNKRVAFRVSKISVDHSNLPKTEEAAAEGKRKRRRGRFRRTRKGLRVICNFFVFFKVSLEEELRGYGLEKREGLEERGLEEEWGKNALHIRILQGC
jgi:hypothetical protein